MMASVIVAYSDTLPNGHYSLNKQLSYASFYFSPPFVIFRKKSLLQRFRGIHSMYAMKQLALFEKQGGGVKKVRTG